MTSSTNNFFFALLLICLVAGCQDPSDPTVTTPPEVNPLIDSAATVFITDVIDPVSFKIPVNGSTTNAEGVRSYEEFVVKVIGVEVFDSEPGDSLTAQAERAGINTDSALTLGMGALMFADSIYNSATRIRRDPSFPNMDGRGRFLRHVAVQVGYDSTGATAVYGDVAELLRERHFAQP